VNAKERREIKDMVKRILAVSESDVHENGNPQPGETSYTVNKD
jgi:hypothetical protein